jgi:signal transduction histidine kinase
VTGPIGGADSIDRLKSGCCASTMPRPVSVLSDQAPTADAGGGASARVVLLGVLLACVLALAAVTSEPEDWQPLSLVVALGALMVFAETISTWARKLRMSGGLMVQVTIMALLGPAPAATIGVLAMAIDGRVNRQPLEGTVLNMVIFGLLGIVGGLLMEGLSSAFGFEPEDGAYALLVICVYLVLMAADLALVAATAPGLTPEARRRVFTDIGLPTIPLELLSSIMAGVAVLTWAHAGLAAVIALLAVLVITIPLARSLGSGLTHVDDLAALREVSDQRAAEVSRLSSDRDRLLSEVLDAEQRERARLAESLHDGPVQRLAVMRQDLAEGASPAQLARNVDAALAETRAIISAFHPVMVRELGFEASLRAAIAPFPAGRSVALTITSEVDDASLARTVLLPVAQELLVNAVKHASPSTIDVSVRDQEGGVILEVSDDGVGIDTSDAGRAVRAGHLGLAMVRRRVEVAGGRFEIETRADGGTRSSVDLPQR